MGNEKSKGSLARPLQKLVMLNDVRLAFIITLIRSWRSEGSLWVLGTMGKAKKDNPRLYEQAVREA